MENSAMICGDEGVKATNDDASECKRSAVKLKYWQDDYISHFIKSCERKAPEINRGYFARVKGVEIFIDKFLKIMGKNCQIVNLGCGFDTLYWRLHDLDQVVNNFVEMDFPSVTARKSHAIKKNKILLDKIHAEDGEVIIREGDLHADGYHLMGCDLRCLSEVQRKMERTGIQHDLPTLFIAECVLVYMKPEPCRQLLSYIASTFTNSMIISYEQVNLNDKFGDVMLSNLSARGCLLAGAEFCTSLDTQKDRFISAGWTSAKAWDMETVWNAIPAADRRRVESIEMLDERELLIQLFQHYCIVLASKGPELSEITLDS